jgi:SOS-response transcriptional repressor LexA
MKKMLIEINNLVNSSVIPNEQESGDNGVMSSLQDRINELFTDYPDRKNTDLAKYAKIARATVTNWRTGKSQSLDDGNSFAIAKFFSGDNQINPEWVQSGKGRKFISKSYSSNVELAPDLTGVVPLISFVQAGQWCETIDNLHPGEAEVWLPCTSQHGPHTYALRVRGDSMTSPYPGQRTYIDGSIIFVDPDRVLTNGCRVIAKLSDAEEATFKEYQEDSGKRYLKPLNPQYQMQEITDETRICGVIIGQYLPE